MADEQKSEEKKQELAKAQEKSVGSLSFEEVMAHPAVQQLSQRLEETKQLLQGLPEAIGRAVAEAQRAAKPAAMTGPAVVLRPSGGSVEFHRKGRIVENGEEVVPENVQPQTSLDQDLHDVRTKAPARQLKKQSPKQ